MDALQTEQYGPRRLTAAVIGGAIGLVLAVIFDQLLKYGYIYALIALGLTILLLIAMDSYRIWILLVVASNLSTFRHMVAGFNIRPDHVVFLALLIIWTLSFLAGRARLRKVPMLTPLLLLLAVNFSSSLLFSPIRRASLQGAGVLTFYALMYILTVIVLRERPEILKKAIYILLAIAAIQAVVALVGLALDYGGLKIGLVTSPVSADSTAVRAQGGFQEADILGAFAGAMALVALSMMLVPKDVFSRKNLLYGCFGLLILALVLSYTRAAWVGTLAGGILLFIIKKPHIQFLKVKSVTTTLALISLGLILIFIIGSNFAPGLGSSITSRAGDILNFSGGSGQGRVQVQQVALDRWRAAPILGHGTLSMPKDAVWPSPAGAWLYSSLIQTLYDTGVAGAIFYIWFEIGVIVVIIKGYSVAKNPKIKSMLAGFAAAMVVLIISSQASSFLWLSFPWIFMGLAVAIATNEIHKHMQEIGEDAGG